MDSFRELLAWVEEQGDCCRVSREVNPRHELSAVTQLMQKGPNKTLLFPQVRGTEFVVATNV